MPLPFCDELWERNLANPKSPTWAVISSFKSTFPSFKSQWTTGGSQSWCSYLIQNLHQWQYLVSGSNVPSWLFPWRESQLMLAKKPFFGTSPSKLLKDKFNFCKALSFSNSVGIRPERLLEERSNLSSAARFSSDFGIEPVILFLAMFRRCKIEYFLVIAGIFPDSWFPQMSMIWSCLKWLNSLGKERLDVLFANSKNFIWEAKKFALECFHWVLSLPEQASLIYRWHVAILMGILPDNLLFAMLSSYSHVRLQKISGISPENKLSVTVKSF